MTARSLAAIATLLLVGTAGCVASPEQAASLEALSRSCPSGEDCEGGDREVDDPVVVPVPAPWVDTVPDCGGEVFDGPASPQPYRTDHAAWMRQAHRHALALGFATGFANFHQADYGSGTVYGTYSLSSFYVAMGQDVTRADLGWPALEDVPTMMRRAQAFARRSGFPAALPSFEQSLQGGEVVYGLSMLSPATVEVREVDGCELGDPRVGDVGGLFRGAWNYASRNGYMAGIPTFEYRNSDREGRSIWTVILLVRGPGETGFRDVERPEIDPSCGRSGLPPCDDKRECADGHIYSYGTCEPIVAPPPCGGSGERCCTTSGCRDGLACLASGFNRFCGPPPVSSCGDRICQIGTDGCGCSDCVATWACASSCGGEPTRDFGFCAVCGGHATHIVQSACSLGPAATVVSLLFPACPPGESPCREDESQCCGAEETPSGPRLCDVEAEEDPNVCLRLGDFSQP